MRTAFVIHASCLLFLPCGKSDSGDRSTIASVSAVARRRTPQPRICDIGGGGLLLPLYEREHEWPQMLRGFCYALGLIYCFVGVSIIADIFMSSIEAITSRRVQIVDDNGELRTVFCWNATVANLSLMALGSSAPEIFLSIIDLVRKRMYAGELGPSTIVGSAAFNLLVIVAVCVICIPYPESREIEQLEVFCLTAVFSVLAYLWMAFILIVQSPDEVEWWEAVITLLFLPVFIVMAYKVDTMGWAGLLPHQVIHSKRYAEDIDNPSSLDSRINVQYIEQEKANNPSGEQKRASFASTRALSNASPTGEQKRASFASSKGANASSFLSKSRSCSFDRISNTSTGSSRDRDRRNSQRRKSIAQFHMLAMSRAPGNLSRGSPSFRLENGDACSRWSGSLEIRNSKNRISLHGLTGHEKGEEKAPSVQFLVDRQSMPENIDKKIVKICRKEIGYRMRVHYKIEMLAEACVLPLPYIGAYDITDGNLTMATAPAPPRIAALVCYGQWDLPAKGFEREFIVNTPKVPDGSCKDFLVSLRGAEVLLPPEGGEDVQGGVEKATTVRHGVGPIMTTQVDVRPFKDPSYLSFISQAMTVPGRSEDSALKIIVLRKGGCSGTVSCSYCTEALDAVPNYDYRDTQGHLTFTEGVTEQVIEVDIFAKSVNRGTYKFLMCLKPSTKDACKFDPAEDGGADSALLTIQIAARAADRRGIDNLTRRIDKWFNIGMVSTANAEWKEQIISTCYCRGSADLQESATMQDWIFHVFTLPWQILFLIVPPTAYGGGWVCFSVSLFVIAVVTAVIADCAELFGCIVDIGDLMTAITFVALGTSMPDLFASKVAAAEDQTADASVVNVTGSNAVNVFLGLGLPWTAATIYWALRDDLRSEWEREYPEMAETHKFGCVFVVPSGNLGFCVLVFSCFAVLALSVLVFRRWKLGCELGGPAIPKAFTAFSLVFMWCGYVFLASWRYARSDAAEYSEVIMVVCGTFLVEVVVASGVVVSSIRADLDSYKEEKAIHEAGTLIAKEEDSEATDATQAAEQALRRSIDLEYHEPQFTEGRISLASSLFTRQSSSPYSRQSSPSLNCDTECTESSNQYASEEHSSCPGNVSLATRMSTPVSVESQAVLPHGLMKAPTGNGAFIQTKHSDAHMAKGVLPTYEAFVGPKLVPKAQRETRRQIYI